MSVRLLYKPNKHYSVFVISTKNSLKIKEISTLFSAELIMMVNILTKCLTVEIVLVVCFKEILHSVKVRSVDYTKDKRIVHHPCLISLPHHFVIISLQKSTNHCNCTKPIWKNHMGFGLCCSLFDRRFPQILPRPQIFIFSAFLKIITLHSDSRDSVRSFISIDSESG